jgi:hypothetical protein
MGHQQCVVAESYWMMEVPLRVESLALRLFLESVFDPRELPSGYPVPECNPPVTNPVLRSDQRVGEWQEEVGCQNRIAGDAVDLHAIQAQASAEAVYWMLRADYVHYVTRLKLWLTKGVKIEEEMS